MSLTTCKIHIIQRPEKLIYISAGLMRSLGMSGTRSIRLTVGSKSLTAPIRLLKTKSRLLRLPVTIAASLKLPYAGTVLAIVREGREIQLGPLIGILTTLSNSRLSPFGSRTAFIRQFMNAGKDRSFQFAFSPKDVNWQDETVVGYFPTSSGTWQRKVVPLPDVVYNRLPSRRSEKQLSMDTFKERFIRRGIPLFNWSFFDKWDVYTLLSGEEVNKYVPDSSISPSSKVIKDMIEKHKFVYLKPTAGSLGNGIYRLTYNPLRGYYARYRKHGTNVLVRYPRFEGLVSMLARHQRGKLNHYVVQQGIRLIELDNCPIDFRFHMTKNGKNEWVVAAIGAKKAGRGSVTTHIRNGGQLMTPEQVLNNVFGSRASQVLQSAKNAAVELAETIEKNYGRRLGEIGFDLGIDQSEQIWMFEANAKPGRSIFKHPSLKSQGRQTLVNLFDHCLYLSKFQSGRE